MRVRMLAWALLLPFLKRCLPAERLVRLMYLRPRATGPPAHPARIVRLAAWAARRRPLPGRDNCLERSLLAYRYLSRAGAQPRLVMGVRREHDRLTGHAWIAVAGRAVEDRTEEARFATIVEFGANGQPVRSPAGVEPTPVLGEVDWGS